MARQGRNALCACGSGKKYKACHGGQKASSVDNTPESRTRFILAVVGFAAVAAFCLYTLFSSSGTAETSADVSPPEGVAPAGKVWSSEHGHYH